MQLSECFSWMKLLQLWLGCCAAFSLVVLLSGCSEPPEFRLNAVESRRQEITALNGEKFAEPQIANLGDLMTALFGTPDKPIFPYELLEEPDDGRALVSLDRLKIAAGPVKSDQHGKPQGLYREHCAHCHGVTGDGLGPTAATLNPYPRDFRMGKFKYKSTPLGSPPTRDDLRRILVNGIPGTAMPSFRLLQKQDPTLAAHLQPAVDADGNPASIDNADSVSGDELADDELEALVDYVIYLSIRGQVERVLLGELTALEATDRLLEIELANSKEDEDLDNFNAQLDILYGVVIDETGPWIDVNLDQKVLADRPAALALNSDQRQAMIDRGRELFLGKANCHSCHGPSGMGDGQTDKYDAWTEEWMNVVKDSPELLKEFEALGVLPARKLQPRNLRQGVFRGGQRPIDLYVKIKYGIDGTPMPGAPGNMPEEDVWAIVEYVRQLHQESDTVAKPVNDRVVD
jgi:mono/diheme cytochrome c family protein